MAEKKTNNTITLTEEQLQNIIKTSIESMAQVTANSIAKTQPQDVAESRVTATRMDQARLRQSMEFNQRLLKSERIPVALPVSLSEYFGDSVTVSVNGNTIKIPVDGNTYHITKAHNQQLQKKIMYNNKQLSRIRNTKSNAVFGNSRGDIGFVNL